MQTIKNVVVRSWIIRVEDQARIGCEQRAPRIGTANSLRTKAFLRPRHIFNRMGWLHRGDDTEFGEARDI